MDGNNVELDRREAIDEAEQARWKAAEEFEHIAERLSKLHPKNRLMSIVLTKIEEAALWYAKLLKEEEDGREQAS